MKTRLKSCPSAEWQVPTLTAAHRVLCDCEGVVVPGFLRDVEDSRHEGAQPAGKAAVKGVHMSSYKHMIAVINPNLTRSRLNKTVSAGIYGKNFTRINHKFEILVLCLFSAKNPRILSSIVSYIFRSEVKRCSDIVRRLTKFITKFITL
jgi:hypothetical protein